MNFKALVAAAALTMAPFAAHALSVLDGTPSFDATFDKDGALIPSQATLDLTPTNHAYQIFAIFAPTADNGLGVELQQVFTNNSGVDVILAAYTAIEGNEVLDQFLTVTVSNPASGPTALGTDTFFDSIVVAQGATATFNWGGKIVTGLGADSASITLDVQVATVPVPAGILLMGTALAGFGVMRRRKKAA